ncbi:hypothetical protein ACQR1I_16580 [Bradyrhizobium sp. HKCCYLS2038]|uniref:hypothetical protein n=1 Tax=unclassified Bradyrhizobium TaxID=2631580 RepID=UPI003EBD92C4
MNISHWGIIPGVLGAPYIPGMGVSLSDARRFWTPMSWHHFCLMTDAMEQAERDRPAVLAARRRAFLEGC